MSPVVPPTRGWKGNKMENWVLVRKGGDFQKLGEKFGISPRLAALIRNRDITEEEMEAYLFPDKKYLHDGAQMKGMKEAVSLLREKIERGARIRIIGDYDIDGVNATYILLKGCSFLGAKVDSDIPDRMTDGYGISRDLIDRALKDGIDTIITCDNGIAAEKEIRYAKEQGMTVIVTDHHEIPYGEQAGEKQYRLPPADVVVDPKREDETYPFSGLCGAGVAYKLLEVLYKATGADRRVLEDLLENVAIATVGDVMELQGENRILTKEGLNRLKHTKNPGLQALFRKKEIEQDRISSYTIGYVIGPCLNAGGRLRTAKKTLELLLAEEEERAGELAEELAELNEERKAMTEAAVREATEKIEAKKERQEKVLVSYLPECHESLAGIVAGRIRERYHRPTYVVTKGKEGLKGSGRSIPAYPMYERLSLCKDLLIRFGGHKGAAGFSLEEDKLKEFENRLENTSGLTQEDLAEKVCIDMELPFSEVTETFVRELSLLEPFGQGNQKPVFGVRNVRVMGARLLGKQKNVLKLMLADQRNTWIDGLCFSGTEVFLKEAEEKYGEQAEEVLFAGQGAMKVDLTFYPQINAYGGRMQPQIVITHFRIRDPE